MSRKRYRYTGKEKDEETGLYYHGARYYAPWLGRWTSADPIGLGDGPNRFAYVRGNPVGSKDPTGTDSVGAPLDEQDAAAVSAIASIISDLYNPVSAPTSDESRFRVLTDEEWSRDAIEAERDARRPSLLALSVEEKAALLEKEEAKVHRRSSIPALDDPKLEPRVGAKENTGRNAVSVPLDAEDVTKRFNEHLDHILEMEVGSADWNVRQHQRQGTGHVHSPTGEVHLKGSVYTEHTIAHEIVHTAIAPNAREALGNLRMGTPEAVLVHEALTEFFSDEVTARRADPKRPWRTARRETAYDKGGANTLRSLTQGENPALGADVLRAAYFKGDETAIAALLAATGAR